MDNNRKIEWRKPLGLYKLWENILEQMVFVAKQMLS